MTKEQFEKCVIHQCQLHYADLKNGKRVLRLEKRRKQMRSLTDFIKVNESIGPIELFNSSARTFGYVMEDAARDYAKLRGADVEKKIKYMKTKIDLMFKYNGVIYNLESKTDVELDAGKSKIEKRRLGKLHEAANALFDCDYDNTKLITKMLVWTAPLSSIAVKFVKYPLTENDLMGYMDFFILFGVEINEQQFGHMIRKIWYEEVEAYFYPKKINGQLELEGITDGKKE